MFSKIKNRTRSSSCLRSDYYTDSLGNMIVAMALALPVVFGSVGAAVDFGTFAMKQSTLQAAGDAAALAGAKELALASSSDASITKTTLSYLAEQLKDNDADAVGTVLINRKLGSVKVSVSEAWQPFFGQLLSEGITPVIANATASMVGSASICVLTLNKSSNKALHMDKSSKLTANGCGVYSNSTNSIGLTVDQSAALKAILVCSAGGVKQKGTISPAALTDCPVTDDPLASRVALATNGCDYLNLKISSGFQTLNPGRYCGGLEVSGTAIVKLGAGNYIIKNGPLTVSDTAKFSGDHVGFYLSGLAAMIDFSGDSEISLTGSTSAEMSGLLFFEDRAVPLDRRHKISSNLVKVLTGTIYLPRGYLLVNPNSVVAGQSAYTAIIANRLELTEGPELILNSNYSATDVPVPDGIRTSVSVVLSN